MNFWQNSISQNFGKYVSNINLNKKIILVNNVRFASNSSRSSQRQQTNPLTARYRLMLYVLTARKKQPRRLNYPLEDWVKHRTIHRAWCRRKVLDATAKNNQLQQQYLQMKEAADDLLNEHLPMGSASIVHSSGVRFPEELKVPTETPPKEVWNYDWNREVVEKMISER